MKRGCELSTSWMKVCQLLEVLSCKEYCLGKPTGILHMCVWLGGLLTVYFNMHYFFTHCKSLKAATVGWFDYLVKVVASSPPLFPLGNFLQIKGITPIFYTYTSFVFPREKEIHGDIDLLPIFKPVAWAHKSRLTKSPLALLQKLLWLHRSAGSQSKRQEVNWVVAAHLISNHIFKSVRNAICEGLWK